jgi:small subunit ribosomal protein S18
MKKKKKKEVFNQYGVLQQQTPKTPRKKKADPLKSRGITFVDFKDIKLLSRFVNEQGKILPNRITGVSSKMQRKITTAIKRARHLSLLPFVTDEFK